MKTHLFDSYRVEDITEFSNPTKTVVGVLQYYYPMTAVTQNLNLNEDWQYKEGAEYALVAVFKLKSFKKKIERERAHINGFLQAFAYDKAYYAHIDGGTHCFCKKDAKLEVLQFSSRSIFDNEFIKQHPIVTDEQIYREL